MTFWAVKSVMHYRDPTRASWYEDRVDPLLDFCVPAEYDAASRLVAMLNQEAVISSARPLKSVSRAGSKEVRLGDWVFVMNAQSNKKACAEATQVRTHAHTPWLPPASYC